MDENAEFIYYRYVSELERIRLEELKRHSKKMSDDLEVIFENATKKIIGEVASIIYSKIQKSSNVEELNEKVSLLKSFINTR